MQLVNIGIKTRTDILCIEDYHLIVDWIFTVEFFVGSVGITMKKIFLDCK